MSVAGTLRVGNVPSAVTVRFAIAVRRVRARKIRAHRAILSAEKIVRRAANFAGILVATVPAGTLRAGTRIAGVRIMRERSRRRALWKFLFSRKKNRSTFSSKR